MALQVARQMSASIKLHESLNALNLPTFFKPLSAGFRAQAEPRLQGPGIRSESPEVIAQFESQSLSLSMSLCFTVVKETSSNNMRSRNSSQSKNSNPQQRGSGFSSKNSHVLLDWYLKARRFPQCLMLAYSLRGVGWRQDALLQVCCLTALG